MSFVGALISALLHSLGTPHGVDWSTEKRVPARRRYRPDIRPVGAVELTRLFLYDAWAFDRDPSCNSQRTDLVSLVGALVSALLHSLGTQHDVEWSTEKGTSEASTRDTYDNATRLYALSALWSLLYDNQKVQHHILSFFNSLRIV